MGHEFGDFLARDGRVCLGRDVAVQEQAQTQQDYGFDPAEGALLAQDAGAGAAADRFGVHGAQHCHLAFVVQLQGQEEFGEAAAEDQLVVQQGGPEFFVPAAVDVRALEELHEGLADLHRKHAGVPREQGCAVDKRVPRGDREGVRVDMLRVDVLGTLRSACVSWESSVIFSPS